MYPIANIISGASAYRAVNGEYLAQNNISVGNKNNDPKKKRSDGKYLDEKKVSKFFGKN